jgi:histidinol phosphatase-like PHP family hydrolase
VSTEKEQIEAAIAKGLDGIAITDHWSQRDAAYLRHLNVKYAPFKIFAGVEIHVRDVYEDVLIIGLHEMADYNEKHWTYPELYKFAREKGAFIAIPHPFRYSDKVNCDVVNFVPDALELKSKNIDPANANRIIEFANELGVKTIVTSDAHHKDNVGMYYLTLQNKVETDAELTKELRSGRYEMSKN